MTDLIKRDDAPNPPEYLCTFPSCGCVAKGQWCPAPRSPAAIREAALREAVAACRQAETDWNAIAYEKRQAGKDDNFACASASAARKNADAILALIGEKK